jgi:hypothetical protein
MSDVEHTYVDTNNGWGGTALGAGFGGLIGSWFGNGMNGGWGGNGNTYQANQLSAIQTQAVANGLATQQAVSNASQQVTEAVNSNGRDTSQAINQGTINAVQNAGDTKLTIANSTNNVAQLVGALGANLAQALGNLTQTVTNQGYEARLSQQQLALQLTQQHNELLKAIDREGCANRELQRQIQTEVIAGALADAKSQVNILKQTQDIVAQLKPAAST